jgi:hypothetical protein
MEMDNSTTQEVEDNGQAQSGSTGTAEATTTATQAAPSSWKATLNTDLRNSPLLQKFDDSPEGLNKALESHANLEKLLGHEKVPIPKDVNDVEGWNRFSKAMGIPDKAEGYGLPDPNLPPELQGSIDKAKFAEVVHAHKLTPAQAKGLWEAYNQINLDSYNQATKAQQEQIVDTVNKLKSEWGEAYQTNVELGQMVINKFSDDQEMNDYITSVLAQDPRGVKFLAKIGDQFAENKVGEFQMKRFSLGPEQAREEWQKIVRDPNHAYNSDRATPRERQAAIDYVNSLIKSANGMR